MSTSSLVLGSPWPGSGAPRCAVRPAHLRVRGSAQPLLLQWLAALAALVSLGMLVFVLVDPGGGPRPPGARPSAQAAASSAPAPKSPASAASAPPSAVPQPALAQTASQAARPDTAVPAPSGVVVIPQPIPLQRGMREYRDLGNGELPATALAGDPTRGRASSPDGRRAAQLGGAPITERELGLRHYPQATPDLESATLAQDPDIGTTRTISLLSRDPVDRIVAHYRAQLGVSGPVREFSPTPGQFTLEAAEEADGGRRTVLIWREGESVRVTVMRWTPPRRG